MKTVAVGCSMSAQVDDEHFDLVSKYRWHAQRGKYTWYAISHTRSGGKRATIYMHRLITDAPRGRVVDHHDGDGLNNQTSNLRVATDAQNQANRHRLNRNNKSGYRGVYKHGQNSSWIAKITIGGANKHIGSFSSPEAAYQAYCEAARAVHGEFARL